MLRVSPVSASGYETVKKVSVTAFSKVDILEATRELVSSLLQLDLEIGRHSDFDPSHQRQCLGCSMTTEQGQAEGQKSRLPL